MLRELLQFLGKVFNWVYILSPWEQAVLVRHTRKRLITQCGLHIRIPFVDRVYRQPIKKRVITAMPQTIVSRDGKVFVISVGIIFHIDDLMQLYMTLEQPNDTVCGEVACAITEYILERDAASITVAELTEFLKGKINLSSYGMACDSVFVLSLASCKTYRFITGDIQQYERDVRMSMGDLGSTPR